MSKKILLVSDQDLNSFCSDWIHDVLTDYFVIEYYDEATTYNPADTLVVTGLYDKTNWYKQLYKEGFKIVIDNLWEIPVKSKLNNALVCTNKNWFWYNESLWANHLGAHNYNPTRNIDKTALLLMNRRGPARDWIANNVDITKLVYSYVGNGVVLADDLDQTHGDWQRYFNPRWYNSTAFSLVAETTVSDTDPLFITEKTFKPIALQHPFMIAGQSGVLAYLHDQGFETFENMFNEHYDNIANWQKRLTAVVDQVNTYDIAGYDLLTINKLAHNKQQFFNQDLVKSRLIKELIEPLLDYAET